jgi:hypothetical protein
MPTVLLQLYNDGFGVQLSSAHTKNEKYFLFFALAINTTVEGKQPLPMQFLNSSICALNELAKAGPTQGFRKISAKWACARSTQFRLPFHLSEDSLAGGSFL